MSGAADDGFLARWSRRKGQAARGITPPAQEPPPASPGQAAAPAPAVAPAAASGSRIAGAAAAQPTTAAPDSTLAAAPAPAPTLNDVAELTPASDFTRFVARDVDASVKNAALKKLFADPHFNVMDGLDTYIDDYNRSEPMPRALLRQTMQARVLGLLDDELEAQPAQQAPTPSAATTAAPAPVRIETTALPQDAPSAKAQASTGPAQTPAPPPEHPG
ncbi:MAG TPA: DUF3306 domain-containing protein [Rubrivivax sp.]|nr:DUF3306 domain-containing protein [Rubrivivax sp.]